MEAKSSTSQGQKLKKLKQIKMSDTNIQEIQILEQNLQNLILQRQAFEMELAETDSALSEVSNSSDDVFKIIGQILVKTDKKKIQSELENKKKMIELRLKSFEKQENSLNERLDKLRKELTDKLK